MHGIPAVGNRPALIFGISGKVSARYAKVNFDPVLVFQYIPEKGEKGEPALLGVVRKHILKDDPHSILANSGTKTVHGNGQQNSRSWE